MSIIKSVVSWVKAAFSEAVECHHGDVQCGKCAQDWYADGEGIGPVMPQHDRPQRGVIPREIDQAQATIIRPMG